MEKEAYPSGQDLRSTLHGKVSPPTRDSLAFSNKLLNQSTKNSQLTKNPGGPSLQQMAPSAPNTNAGSLPKLGEAMENDPLIAYLKKEAEMVDNNEDAAQPAEVPAPELQDECPHPTMVQEALAGHKSMLKELFDASDFRKKYMDKEQ